MGLFLCPKMSKPLALALQKGGRLSEKSISILKDCGIEFETGSRKLISRAKNFPLEVLFLRDDDIPEYVANGIAQIGILGKDVLLESKKELKLVKGLGFAQCRMSLAVPNALDYPGKSFFQNKRIATSFPHILQSWLDENQIQAETEYISGSVELAPSIGLSEAICDIVSSGSTLKTNGLKEVERIMDSEAVLVSNVKLNAEQQALLDGLRFRMEAVERARSGKYISLNAPDASLDRIREILPGLKSPTIVPLADPGWSAIHTVVQEKVFWESIDQLKAAGAQGIVVLPIEKMILWKG